MAKIYTRNNSPYWWARYCDPNGLEVRCSLKIPKGRKSKEIAQLRAGELELEHWQAWKEGTLDKPLYTFDALMLGWINERNPGSADINNVAKLKTVFGGRILDEIKGREIADCKRLWLSDGLSNNTIRRRLSTFSSALTYARSEWEWEINNPVRGRLPAEEEFEADHLTYEQAQVFIDALQCRQFQPFNAPHLFDFFILALHTGMRKSELLNCRLSQIDFENRCIHLKKQQQKGRKRTATPLNDEALEAVYQRLAFIETRYPNTEWLFPSATSKGLLPIKDIKTAFNTLRIEVGAPKFRIHDLRHTFASWLVQRGRSLYETSKALRHSSLKPTQRYAHLELDHLRNTHAEMSKVPVSFKLISNASQNPAAMTAKKQWREALKKRKASAVVRDSAHNPHIALQVVK